MDLVRRDTGTSHPPSNFLFQVDYGRWSAGEPNNMNGNEGCVEVFTGIS